MGDVDDVDAGRGYYPIHFKRIKRWWLNILFWLLEIVLNNALILYNSIAATYKWKQKTAKEYRRNLAVLLVGELSDEATVNIPLVVSRRSSSVNAASPGNSKPLSTYPNYQKISMANDI